MKSKTKQIVITSILVNVLLYLIFSFYWVSINPTVWSYDSRALLGILVVLSSGIITVITIESNERPN